MRVTVIIVIVLAVIGLIAWAALRNPTAQPAAPAVNVPPTTTAIVEFPTVPRTPLDEGRREVDAGTVTVIDVRDADAYIAGHIPGSLHIPLSRIEGEIQYLPRDKAILTYCT